MSRADQQRAQNTWVSAHVYHHGDTDSLLAGAIAPAVDALADAGALAGHFFIRYWEGGPHVRVRMLPRAPGDADRIRTTLAEHVGAYLAAHPSAPVLTAVQYRDLAAELAAGEGMTEHDTRLHPNDFLEFAPYRPELDAFGSRTDMTLVEGHFAVSSDLALHAVRQGRTAQWRASTAYALLVATLAACMPDGGDFRLAWEGLAAHPATASAVRSAEERLRADRGRVVALTRRAWTAAGEPSGALRVWATSIGTLRRHLEALSEPGRTASPLGLLAVAVPVGSRATALRLLRCAHLFANRLGLPHAVELDLAALAVTVLSAEPPTSSSVLLPAGDHRD